MISKKTITILNTCVLSTMLILTPLTLYAAVADYLVLDAIGPYKLFTGISGRVFSGPPSKYSQSATGGILDAAAHYAEGDVSYEASYTETSSKWPFVKVEVTQHTGAESDTWLMHEVEDGYRDEEKLNATVDTNVQVRSIDGKNIYFIGIYGGKSYSWLANGNIVVRISCSNCPNTKPEPLDIVKAYLAKHASVISITDVELKSKAHSEKWIKDEMDRRLWLADKWFAQIQTADPKLGDKIKSMTDSVVVFLNYREKYYEVASRNEKIALETALSLNNVSAVQTKLTEYKAWWIEHKADSIILP